jgi:hypothetical protein
MGKIRAVSPLRSRRVYTHCPVSLVSRFDSMARAPLMLLLAACAWAPQSAAQLIPLAEGGARSIALGRAATALQADVWGTSNPASWAGISQPGAAVFASQAFGITELRLGAAAAAIPTRYAVFAGSARTYGFEDFREPLIAARIGRSVALSPTRRLHLGAALRFTSVSIPEFGSAGAVGLSAGLIVELMPGLEFGAHGSNLNRPSFSALDPLETRLDGGLAYRAHERALVVLAASKDLDYPMSIRGGIEVQPVDPLFTRAGFSTEPTRFSAGIGVVIGHIRVDVAAEQHHTLGWTPGFEVGLSW